MGLRGTRAGMRMPEKVVVGGEGGAVG